MSTIETISTIAHNFAGAIAAVVTPIVTVYGANQTRKIGLAVEQRNMRRRSAQSSASDWISWAHVSFKREAS